MDILSTIANSLPKGRFEQIALGSHWIASVVQTENGRACGIASTPTKSFALNPDQRAQVDALLGKNANNELDALLHAADLPASGFRQIKKKACVWSP